MGPPYNFKVEEIHYTVELAKDYLFNTVFYRQENLILPELTMYTLPAGQYFLRVRATNASGYTQDAFDYYVTEAGKHYGMICFTSSLTAALRRTPMKNKPAFCSGAWSGESNCWLRSPAAIRKLTATS